MSIFKCKMCGGTLEINNNETVVTCEYCCTQQTLPRLYDDKRANMYDRANHFRRNNEFDKAMGIYEQILNEDNTDAEAYWSLVLCRYGIEYVEDPSSHKRIPTVNRAQFTSIFDDDNYKSALQYADSLQCTIYEKEAKAINEIQKNILAISAKEEPFDVFICYKDSDNSGRRTPDSVLAQDLYYQLTQEGFKVFFSRITLEDKLGSAYEPYIFAALNSAKVMVVLGTKPEYFNAVWVKNEWSRYLSLIKQGQKKMLIPAYKDMDPYDLPEEFSHLQAQDMSKLGFMQDLIRGIKKVVRADEPKTTVIKETVISGGNAGTAPLLKRAFMFLEDGDWNSAKEYCEKVLDQDPENAEAYVGKVMAEFKICCREKIGGIIRLEKSENFKKAIRFGGEPLIAEFKKYKEENAKQSFRAGRYDDYVRLLDLREFTIPDGVTSIKDNAFDYCSRLTSITIPDSVTSIGEEAFYKCSGLTSVTIGKGVTSIGKKAFSGCSGLTSVTIGNGVTSIGEEAFYKCSGLTSVTIGKGVTSIGDMAFYYCSNLTSVTIGNSVTSIGKYAFYGCSRLTSITIPDGVTSIGDMAFYYCSNLTSVTIGKGVTSIGSSAFRDCNKLKNIYITDIASWCKIKNLGNLIAYGSSNIKLYCNNTLLTDLVIPDSVTSIGAYAFNGCSSLTSVTIGNGVTSIGAYAFAGCRGLTSITISDSVTSIGEGAFYGCASLVEITIPFVGAKAGVTSRDSYQYPFGYIFGTSSYTGGIEIKQYYIETVYSTNSTYYIPSSLKKVTVTGGNILFGAFYGCNGLTSVTLPNRLTVIGQSAFCNCSGLINITIPDSVTSIGDYAFFGCSSLTSVTIPYGTAIGKETFDNRTDVIKKIVRGSTSNSNGCYVATCIYGSYDCPQVWTLRRYRDNTLAPTWYGRAFIRTYYAISPTLVKWFGKTKWFKKMWKWKLDRMVKKLQDNGVESTPYEDKEW